MKFEKPVKRKSKKYLSKGKTHGLKFIVDKKYHKLAFIIIGIIIAVVLYLNYKSGIDFGLSLDNMLAFIMLILFVYFFYYGFLHKHETFISIDKNGIYHKDGVVFWSDILDYGVLIDMESAAGIEVIIRTRSSGIQTIDISGLDVTVEELSEIMELNKI